MSATLDFSCNHNATTMMATKRFDKALQMTGTLDDSEQGV